MTIQVTKAVPNTRPEDAAGAASTIPLSPELAKHLNSHDAVKLAELANDRTGFISNQAPQPQPTTKPLTQEEAAAATRKAREEAAEAAAARQRPGLNVNGGVFKSLP